MQPLRPLVRGVILAAGVAVCGSVPAGAAPATPSSVLLYPSGGQVVVDATLTPADGRITFDLPASALLDTLAISVEGGTVSGLVTSPAPPQPDSPTVAAIRARLQAARQAAAAVAGELAAVNARIALWSTPSVKDTLGDLEKIDSLIPAKLKPLYEEAAALAPRKEAADRQVAWLERELAAAGGWTVAPASANAERVPAPRDGVRVVANVRMDGGETPRKALAVRYSYTLTDCGWSPAYTLDARPEQNLVRFSQEAEIRQASGQDWTGVSLALATANLGSGLTPAPLGSWLLRPLPEVAARGRVSPMQANVMTESAVLLKSAATGDAAVSQMETAAATVWDLGQRNVPAGVTTRLPLTHSEWKAAFLRVARPARQKTVYLMADVTLPEPAVFPTGSARYLVDGISAGGGDFALSGSRDKIFFGSDPRVSAEMKLNTRQSGKAGFVDKRQTRSWTWTITVTNHHATPTLVRVEDPEPQSGDKAIEIQTSASPKGESAEDHVHVWTLTVPAGGKSVITYTVDVSAPSDMRLADGR